MILCPVIRDKFSGIGDAVSPGTGLVVYDVDNHYTADVTCALSSRTVFGTSVTWSSKRRQGSSTWVRALSFASGRPPSGAGYSLACRLPTNSGAQQSWIRSYWGKENNTNL